MSIASIRRLRHMHRPFLAATKKKKMSIGKKTKCLKKIIGAIVLTLISITNHQAQSNNKIDVNFTKQKRGENIEVEITFKNTDKHEIFISSDYSYGGYSENESIIIFDSEYYESPHDWLIMPNLELGYKKLFPNEEWKFKKSKKSNEIKVIYLDFNIIQIGKLNNEEIYQNLENGFITTEQLYSEKLEQHFEPIRMKLE